MEKKKITTKTLLILVLSICYMGCKDYQTDQGDMKEVTTDYITISSWIALSSHFQSSTSFLNQIKLLFNKYEIDLKDLRGSIYLRGDGYKIINDSIVFAENWCNPLQQFSTNSGNFPDIMVRKGTISFTKDTLSYALSISEGTEVLINGIVFEWKNKSWVKNEAKKVLSNNEIEKIDKISFIRKKIKTNEDANIKSAFGRSILQIASEMCAMKTVKYLVKNGADVNFVYKKENLQSTNVGVSINEIIETPLISALNYNCWNVSSFLIENGANVDFCGKTLTNVGLVVMNIELVPLCFATQHNKVDLVKLMLSKNANKNITNSKGMTALMIAAQNGYLEIVKILIDSDVELNKKSNGITALDIAKENGHDEIVEILIEANEEK